jgi:hypothetical protein
MKEELLTEEETLKLLKINKAQLENYVKENRLSPLYQESVRKFKLSDVSKITVEPPVMPLKEETPFIKIQKEGSTRVIEPPKETTKIGIIKTGSKGSTFESEQEPEQFIKQLKKTPLHSQGDLPVMLLIAAFLISAFSVFMLAFTLQGKEFPQINKVLSSIGAVLPIDKEESEKIESQTNSLIRSAQQTKEKAETLTKETREFISVKD